MARQKLPSVTYTYPKRREVLRRLQQRAAPGSDFDATDSQILSMCGLDPTVPMVDYLTVWSAALGEDVTHLAQDSKAVHDEILA